jgi:hypothetical protein
MTFFHYGILRRNDGWFFDMGFCQNIETLARSFIE